MKTLIEVSDETALLDRLERLEAAITKLTAKVEPDEPLTEREAAKWLRMHPRSLTNLRKKRLIAFNQTLDGRVTYSLKQLRAYNDSVEIKTQEAETKPRTLRKVS